MGAWIEIYIDDDEYYRIKESHPTMGAWIEIRMEVERQTNMKSHPTMGAWIEIVVHLTQI